MNILLANPSGFCAGVNRAITMVKRALSIYGSPVYVHHEIVHNRYVVNALKNLGAIFVEDVNEVPDRSLLIFSAHGVSQIVRDKAKKRDLTVLDATCPLVTKVHMEVIRASRLGQELILIGHQGHPEVEGTLGQYRNPEGAIYLVESIEDITKLKVKNENKLSFVTQTTLSIDETASIINVLKHQFPKITGPRKNDICYATTNRQEALRELSLYSDLVLVIGSKNSSNSNSLFRLAKNMGKSTWLIDDFNDIQEEWLQGVSCVGVTAGASAPDILIQEVVKHLKFLGGTTVIKLKGREENTFFEVPKELRLKVCEVQ